MNGAERAHVSLSELRTVASRALHGAGAPAGAERDGARSAVWLESRGFRGAAALVSELDAIARAGIRLPCFDDGRVDLAGGPILIWGSTLVEAAMLARSSHQLSAAVVDPLAETGRLDPLATNVGEISELAAGPAILLAGCRTPRVLLPEAVAQAGHGWSFRLEAGGCEALVTAGGTNLDRSFADLEVADVRLIAAEGPPTADLPPAPPRSRLMTPELESRHAVSLARGLRLDMDDWRAIREAAGRILVPATERSRSSGAGAEVDDNV